MPLKCGKGAVSANVRELYKANAAKPAGKQRGQKQIVAIALAHQRRCAGRKR